MTPLSCVCVCCDRRRLFSWPFPCLALGKVCATQYHSRVLLRDRRRASHKGDFIFKEGGWDDDAIYAAYRGVLFDVIQICPRALGEMNALLAALHTFAHLMRFSPAQGELDEEKSFAKHFFHMRRCAFDSQVNLKSIQKMPNIYNFNKVWKLTKKFNAMPMIKTKFIWFEHM